MFITSRYGIFLIIKTFKTPNNPTNLNNLDNLLNPNHLTGPENRNNHNFMPII